MNLFESLLGGQASDLVSTLAKQVDLDQSTVESVTNQLLPALLSGIKQNARNDGLDSLTRALQSGNHDRYLDNPDVLSSNDAVIDGNAILGHVLGGKEQSRSLARSAAEATGAQESLIKQLLPLVAATAMGALSKQTARGASLNQSNASGLDMGSLLTTFLDSDKDGDITDDLIGLAQKFLK